MEVDRREFLGSVLGMFAATSVPWVARLTTESPIDQPALILPDFRTFIRLDCGRVVQGPGVRVIAGDFVNYHAIEVRRPLVIIGYGVTTRHGILIASFQGNRPFTMNPGEKLAIAHSMSCFD